jgi:hypothetical protein
MTLYKFPSGKIVSDEDYKKTFEEEYPADRPEADPNYIPPSNDKNRQVVFDSESDEEDE